MFEKIRQDEKKGNRTFTRTFTRSLSKACLTEKQQINNNGRLTRKRKLVFDDITKKQTEYSRENTSSTRFDSTKSFKPETSVEHGGTHSCVLLLWTVPLNKDNVHDKKIRPDMKKKENYTQLYTYSIHLAKTKNTTKRKCKRANGHQQQTVGSFEPIGGPWRRTISATTPSCSCRNKRT